MNDLFARNHAQWKKRTCADRAIVKRLCKAFKTNLIGKFRRLTNGFSLHSDVQHAMLRMIIWSLTGMMSMLPSGGITQLLPGFRSNVFLEAHHSYRHTLRRIKATVTVSATETVFHKQTSEDSDKNRHRDTNASRILDRTIRSVAVVEALRTDAAYVVPVCKSHFGTSKKGKASTNRSKAMLLKTYTGAPVSTRTHTKCLTVSEFVHCANMYRHIHSFH
jgi:hypothetical protein